MDDEGFRDLCRETGIALQVDDAEDFAQHTAIRIDDVDVALHFSEELTRDRIFCYLDIGRFDKQCVDAAMRNLLALNLSTGDATPGSYAYDPLHNNALLVVHVDDPHRLDGQSLAEALYAYVAQAKAAREAVFSFLC